MFLKVIGSVLDSVNMMVSSNKGLVSVLNLVLLNIFLLTTWLKL